jgi:uncharacterized protein YcbK (DUF882 family)
VKKSYIKTFYIITGSMLVAYLVVRYIKRKQNIEKEMMEGNSEIETNPVFVASSNENYAKNARSANFSLSDFECNDGTPVPEKYRGNVQVLMNQLEALRKELGNTPIKINSAYRHPAYNKKIGGVTNSEHTFAKAADIRTDKHTPSQIKRAIEKLIAEGKMMQGGIGLYPTFVHYDIRGTKSRW